jgi:hypothetical protein
MWECHRRVAAKFVETFCAAQGAADDTINIARAPTATTFSIPMFRVLPTVFGAAMNGPAAIPPAEAPRARLGVGRVKVVTKSDIVSAISKRKTCGVVI